MRPLLLLLALAATASAQETITTNDLGGPSWGPREGKTLALEGKFEGYFDGDVRLANVAHGKLVTEDEALGAQLARFRLGGDTLDRTGRSNVRVSGVARDFACGRGLAVTGVVKLADDLERLRARAAKPGADLEALAREAASLAKAQNDLALAEWSRETFEAALDARRAAAKDAASAMALARSYLEVAHVASKAVSLLGEHAEDPRARALLEELGAVQRGDRWISREELKAALGWVLRGDRWMTALHAELEAEIVKERAVAKQRMTSPRTLSGALYEKAASEHRLALGMFKTEASVARGFPASVERVTDGEGVTWDQWVFADGQRAYFRRSRGDDALLVDWTTAGIGTGDNNRQQATGDGK